MNRWAIPLVAITITTFGVLLYLSQSKAKEEPVLPLVAEDKFQTISLTPAQNQQAPTVQPTPIVTEVAKATYTATIKTTKGDIKLTLRADAAPNTVKNFITKAQSGFYKNLTFHRVEDWVIQGGDPSGNGTGGGNIPVEFNNLAFGIGALGSASRGDGKVQNDAQFFITKTDASWLNGQYTNFGNVTDGMDVVSKMQVGDKILGIMIEN